MNIKKAMVTLLPILAAFGLSACASTDLENTTYRLTKTDTYTDIDLDVSLTITDLTYDEAEDGSYSQTCMIQFSGDDCEKFLEYVKDYLVYNEAAISTKEAGMSDPDVIGQNLEYYLEYYDDIIDVKTVLMDNACKFYIYYSTDEEDYTTIYTHLDGANDESNFEILLDSDGTINIYAYSSSYSSYDIYIFCK